MKNSGIAQGPPRGSQPRRWSRPRRPSLLSAEPRRVAFQALKETAAGRTPEDSLADLGRLLAPRDQALAAALVYEVLRNQALLDHWLLASLSAHEAGPDLTLVLRLGLAQLFFFDRLGDHAAVSETVALAKKVVPGRHGLVNAVLRRWLRTRSEGEAWPPVPAAAVPAAPVPVAAVPPLAQPVVQSLPQVRARVHSEPETVVLPVQVPVSAERAVPE